MSTRVTKLAVGSLALAAIAGWATDASAVRNRYTNEEARDLGYFMQWALDDGPDLDVGPRYRPYGPAGYGRPPLADRRYLPRYEDGY